MFKLRTLAVLSTMLVFSHVVQADISGELGLEVRYFPEAGLYGQNTLQPSLRSELEYTHEWDDDSIEFVAFGRVDRNDPERSHADLREAAWTHVGDQWELKAGITKVFWGVTESRHLVDVINQSDIVENIDGEDKLGQAMTKLSFEQDWGTVDLFWLPYFRERTFPGVHGRLGYPIEIDLDHAEYQSGAEEWHSDFAFRYAHYIDDLDFAISHFSGTSRDPLLAFNGQLNDPNFIPTYLTVDQTGLELQYLYGDWIYKFEGITNSGLGERYSAAVFGFEYTQVGIFDSRADLGWILEYLFDDRKQAAPTNFERDIFAGWRYALNDADSSEVLFGVIYDPQSNERFFSLEANKRIANDLKLVLEAKVFDGASVPPLTAANVLNPNPDKKTWFLQDEDHIQLELVKYF